MFLADRCDQTVLVKFVKHNDITSVHTHPLRGDRKGDEERRVVPLFPLRQTRMMMGRAAKRSNVEER